MLRLTGLSIIMIASVGCGAHAEYGKYIPSEDKAQKALESALTAWKEGKPPGPVEGASPAVQLYDSRRQANRRLKDFEILGAVQSDAGPNAFEVRLALENPAEQLKLRFFILGNDPLMVCSQEDYESMGSWEKSTSPAIKMRK